MPALTITPLTLDTLRPTVYSFDFICPEDLPISTWLPDFTIQTSSFLVEFATKSGAELLFDTELGFTSLDGTDAIRDYIPCYAISGIIAINSN